MLSRVANCLFWSARYAERAKNTARMLDLADRLASAVDPATTDKAIWESLLEATGTLSDYTARHDRISESGVRHYLTSDDDNLASIGSCLATVRSNVRSIRGAIGVDVLEYAEEMCLPLEELDGLSASGWNEWITTLEGRGKELRNRVGASLEEGPFFMDVGIDIERADNVARTLDSVAALLSQGKESADYGQVLDLIGIAFDCRLVERVTSDRIVRSTVLSGDCSLKSCYDNLVETLSGFGGAAGELRAANRLRSSLGEVNFETILETGLRDFLAGFVRDNAEVGRQFSRNFMRLG